MMSRNITLRIVDGKVIEALPISWESGAFGSKDQDCIIQWRKLIIVPFEETQIFGGQHWHRQVYVIEDNRRRGDLEKPAKRLPERFDTREQARERVESILRDIILKGADPFDDRSLDSIMDSWTRGDQS